MPRIDREPISESVIHEVAEEIVAREQAARFAIEARALERAARHLDAIAELPVRPDAATYLRERADRLRSGVGWEDEQLFGADGAGGADRG
jgi:hypothetical protein